MAHKVHPSFGGHFSFLRYSPGGHGQEENPDPHQVGALAALLVCPAGAHGQGEGRV